MNGTWISTDDNGVIKLEHETRLIPLQRGGSGPWRIYFGTSATYSAETFADEPTARAAIDDLVNTRLLSDLD